MQVWSSLRGVLCLALVIVVFGLLFLMFGCLPNPPYLRTMAPQATTVASSQSAEAAYLCTVKVIRGLDQIAHVSSDPVSRLVSFQWHAAADMVVEVESHAPGALVNIRGSVPQNKVTTGEFDEVQVLERRVKEQCA